MNPFKIAVLLVGLLCAGCVHIEVFHPDVEGTYHIGPNRPFWAFDEAPRHISIAHIEPVAQQTTAWCWAAAGQMLLRSQGIDISQSQIVERAYGDTRNAGGKSPLFVKALSGSFTTIDGRSVHLVAHRADGLPQNHLELINSIEEGRPFVVDIGFYKDGKVYAAHSLLAYGITYQRKGNAVQILSLDLIDPSYGFMQETNPGYDPHQTLPASDFHTIQGTMGIYPSN